MEILSDRILAMGESETLAMTQIARELKEQGKDIISLSIGEPDFNTPECVKEYAKQAIDDNYTHYPPVPGYADLLKAISHKFKRDNNLDYDTNQIVVSTGGKQAIYQVVMSLVNPGDEVIIPTPYWVSYREIAKVAGGKCVYVPAKLENDFKITAEQLREAITPKTKLIMFSSPSNPTGMLYSKDELRSLAEVVKEHAKACKKLQGQVTSATCSIAQRATIKAMEMDPTTSKDIIDMRNTFKARRDMVFALLNEIPGFKQRMPQGAFYFFPDVSALYGKNVPADSQFAATYKKTAIENSTDLCMYLLYDANVALGYVSTVLNRPCAGLCR